VTWLTCRFGTLICPNGLIFRQGGMEKTGADQGFVVK
jgi:hypothetical protein